MVKFAFSELDWGGTDCNSPEAIADVTGVTIDASYFPFKDRIAVVWDGIWLKVIGADGEVDIIAAARLACDVWRDENQDRLEEFEIGFKRDALKHFLADPGIHHADFDELFTFEWESTHE